MLCGTSKSSAPSWGNIFSAAAEASLTKPAGSSSPTSKAARAKVVRPARCKGHLLHQNQSYHKAFIVDVIYPLKIVCFHSYVELPEGTPSTRPLDCGVELTSGLNVENNNVLTSPTHRGLWPVRLYCFSRSVQGTGRKPEGTPMDK